jgi:K+-transporting ATPase ATPase A chain
MTAQGWLQIALFLAVITALIKPLGGYFARIFAGTSRIQSLTARFETGIYRFAGVDPAEEQSWSSYAVALLFFSVAGIVALYTLQRLQGLLPYNPQHFGRSRPICR